MTFNNFRGLIMAVCGIAIAIYSLSIDGFISFVMTFGGAMMVREGYDWWMDDIQYTPPFKEEQNGKSDL